MFVQVGATRPIRQAFGRPPVQAVPSPGGGLGLSQRCLRRCRPCRDRFGGGPVGRRLHDGAELRPPDLAVSVAWDATCWSGLRSSPHALSLSTPGECSRTRGVTDERNGHDPQAQLPPTRPAGTRPQAPHLYRRWVIAAYPARDRRTAVNLRMRPGPRRCLERRRNVALGVPCSLRLGEGRPRGLVGVSVDLRVGVPRLDCHHQPGPTRNPSTSTR